MTARFQPAVDFAIVNETGGRADGALTRDPVDPGGVTKWGIAQRAHPGVDVVNLTRADACAIYRREYWTALPGLELLQEQRIATKIFDAAIHLGVRGGALCAQRAYEDLRAGLPGLSGRTPDDLPLQPLNIDGQFGVRTAQAINSCEPSAYLAAFVRRQLETYESICARRGGDYARRFMAGFANRARKLPA